MAKRLISPRLRGAETLVEVVMAIFVVALGSATATSLIVSAVQSNAFSRDNLIALNLAVEGVEAVRNIRDSNWLKFSYDKPNCWNMSPGNDVCDDASLIAEGNYTVDLDIATMQWKLSVPQLLQNVLDLNNGAPMTNEFYHLKYLDLDGLGDDHDLYVSGTITPALPADIGDDSKFYRMVTVDYNGVPAETANNMTVTSLVQWNAQGLAHQVVLQTKLFNYQQ